MSQDFAQNSDSLREKGLQIARSYTVSREDVFQIARSSDSLARRRFLDRAKLNRARVKKQDSCDDSRAEESSRATYRESSREDSKASRENKQFRAKI